MGVLDNLFGSKDSKSDGTPSKLSWIALSDVKQLEDIKEKSNSIPQLIFKHSTTCGISRMVLKMFTANFSLEASQMELHFLDLLNHRDISAAIAEKFSVQHQSPQALVIKNGVVEAHASHEAINDIELRKYV